MEENQYFTVDLQLLLNENFETNAKMFKKDSKIIKKYVIIF